MKVSIHIDDCYAGISGRERRVGVTGPAELAVTNEQGRYRNNRPIISPTTTMDITCASRYANSMGDTNSLSMHVVLTPAVALCLIQALSAYLVAHHEAATG